MTAHELPVEARTAVVREIERAGVPGCAIAWTDAEGASGAFVHGLANAATGRAVTHATAFHLFSGTKLYTAAALMLLVERGALRLDAPVRSVLPELPLRDDLTVRHLASHASGLGDTLAGFLAVHFAGERAPSTAEALARYRLGRGAPGRGARYANVNYALLGEIVSRVSTEPYERFVESQLLGPLGATLTFEDAGEPAGNAVGYVGRFSPMLLALRFVVPEVARRIRAGRAGRLVALTPYSLDTAAIGGLVGPGPAFLPLLREMLRPERGVLGPEAKREMLTLHARGAAGVVSRDGVGIGWKRGSAEGIEFWNHEGGGAGFCSETRLYPSAGLGVVILMNLSQSSALSTSCHRIAELVRAAARHVRAS